MQKHHFSTNLFCGAVLLTALLTGSLSAQQKTPAPIEYEVTIVKVKPENNREFQEFIKQDANPASQKGGLQWRTVWTTANFGESGEYIFVTPMESLSALDGPSTLVKGLGQEGAAALVAKRNRFNNSAHSFALTARPDLGVAPKAGYELKLAVSARSHVTPGRTAEFEQHAKALSALIGKTNAKGVLVSKVGLGGDPNEYITLVLFDSYTDIGNFAAAYAKAAAKTKPPALAAGLVAQEEWRVYRMNSELSIAPAAAQKAEH